MVQPLSPLAALVDQADQAFPLSTRLYDDPKFHRGTRSVIEYLESQLPLEDLQALAERRYHRTLESLEPQGSQET